MKEITIEQLSKDTPALLNRAQKERLIVTRNGKPLAVLLGIENKDEEDYALERDEGFWQMIHKRRKEENMVPLVEVKKRVGLHRPSRRKHERTNKK